MGISKDSNKQLIIIKYILLFFIARICFVFSIIMAKLVLRGERGEQNTHVLFFLHFSFVKSAKLNCAIELSIFGICGEYDRKKSEKGCQINKKKTPYGFTSSLHLQPFKSCR